MYIYICAKYPLHVRSRYSGIFRNKMYNRVHDVRSKTINPANSRGRVSMYGAKRARTVYEFDMAKLFEHAFTVTVRVAAEKNFPIFVQSSGGRFRAVVYIYSPLFVPFSTYTI